MKVGIKKAEWVGRSRHAIYMGSGFSASYSISAPDRSSPSPGRAILDVGQAERNRRRADLKPDPPQIDLHRLDRGRQVADAAMRRNGQETLARTRRQYAVHRL
jgi:hypothetical protein